MRRVAAQGQAFFLAVEAVFPEATLGALGSGLQIQTACIGKAHARLVVWAGSGFAGYFGQHGGTKLQEWGKFALFPQFAPRSAALQWRHMTTLEGLNWPKRLILLGFLLFMTEHKGHKWR